ncbi:MAG: 4Fe-4S binding protein [Synergistaceae bacterium]|nr:ATP-binding protein [Synergistota bacterium]NLM70987.1 4Fe-4S binding protein [Synergistaceae bacterium]
MKIAVASGKGGAGKTSIAASLVLGRPGSLAMDLDVEEPNLGILLDFKGGSERPVLQPVASLDPDLCSGCGRCAQACEFGALAWFGSGLPVINEFLCHGCGVCPLVCPTGAMSERDREVGRIRSGTAAGGPFIEGRLKVGSVSTVHVIEETMRAAEEFGERYWIMDGPPGVSCPAATVLRAADAALMVAEPTPFGLSDLASVLEVASDLKKPAAVVVNKAGLGERPLDDLCRRFSVEVLESFPFSRAAAATGALGKCPYNTDADWAARTERLWREMERVFS